MKISKIATDRLLKVNWFANLGKEINMPDVTLALSLKEAENYLSAPEWEDLTLDRSNEISGYLATKHITLFQDWNDIAKESKLFFNNNIKPVIPHLDGFDNTLLHQCIEWDVIHFLIEDFYSGKLNNSFFFNKLISVYESGHIPCGWLGNWPEGNLVAR